MRGKKGERCAEHHTVAGTDEPKKPIELQN